MCAVSGSAHPLRFVAHFCCSVGFAVSLAHTEDPAFRIRTLMYLIAHSILWKKPYNIILLYLGFFSVSREFGEGNL